MGCIHTVGPNEALVISGGCRAGHTVRTVIGGWGWTWCCLNQVQRLSLEVMTLNPRCENVETSEGVPLTVTGVAQVKILNDTELLAAACEQFLGTSTARIEDTILQTLEGHLRAILGTLSVEAIYKDRDQFAALVREVAAPDVGRMGIEILSFTIKDVYDTVEYLNSLGRPQIAFVKRDADIGVAEAERDAGIREAECDKERMNVKYQMDANIADYTRQFDLQKAAFDEETNRARADADMAYALQAAIERQLIRAEEVKVEIVKQGKLIEIEEQEVTRNEKILQATVREPATAEAYRLIQLAEGERLKSILSAEAGAGAIRCIGEAQARVIKAKGDVEAEAKGLFADAYLQYGEAAKLDIILRGLPLLAAEVCAPLSRTAEIVIMSGNSGPSTDVSTIAGLGRDLVRLSGTLPPTLRALTGVDISKCIGQIPGATSIS